MLRLLSGRAHQVTTGVSLVDRQGKSDTRFSTARVHFRKLEPLEVERYIESGEPMDKAGAYAIQGGAAAWIERVEGEYSNVVGLPVLLVKEMLRDKAGRWALLLFRRRPLLAGGLPGAFLHLAPATL